MFKKENNQLLNNKKKIIFFFEPEWAFGSIHYELCKYLFQEGFDCSVLAWNRGYTTDEFNIFVECIDLFVTSPTAWKTIDTYWSLKTQKVALVAHAEKDLLDFLEHYPQNKFDEFYKYAVVSTWLANKSIELGIQRKPEVLSLGINTNKYTLKINENLRVVGYAGTFNKRHPSHIKRAHLVELACNRAGLEFKVAEHCNHSYVTMSGFYKSVDAILIASTSEGGGLPLLEAGASGKLVISTPVGHFKEKAGEKGAISVPLEEESYLHKTVELLTYYKNNPDAYKLKCTEIQQHAQTYDWKYVINKWVTLLE